MDLAPHKIAGTAATKDKAAAVTACSDDYLPSWVNCTFVLHILNAVVIGLLEVF
jgi:hypothetical protein